MGKTVYLILSAWILSHLGHAVMSVFYEKPPATFFVPSIYAAFVLAAVGAWRGNRRAGSMCLILAVVTLLIQGAFIWDRKAYGALSIPVLVLDIMGMAASLSYIVFFVSPQRERHFQRLRGD